MNTKYITCISKNKTNIEQYSLSITIDDQKRKLIYRAPTKAQMILHELVSQIPLFQNYEKKNIFAYVKSRETKDYLKTRVELKLFKRKWIFEIYLKIRVSKII